jgi:hypothetical protein
MGKKTKGSGREKSGGSGREGMGRDEGEGRYFDPTVKHMPALLVSCHQRLQ